MNSSLRLGQSQEKRAKREEKRRKKESGGGEEEKADDRAIVNGQLIKQKSRIWGGLFDVKDLSAIID